MKKKLTFREINLEADTQGKKTPEAKWGRREYKTVAHSTQRMNFHPHTAREQCAL